MRYALEQRLRLIDFLLFHYGAVSRKEIVDFFDISEPQATRDFREYIRLNPDNCTLNQSTKNYIRTDKFRRAFA